MSGELQRLSAQADVMPLMRTHGGLVLSQEGRQLQAAIRREVADGMVQAAKIEIAKEITKRAMAAVKEIDSDRRAIAGQDEDLNMLLGQLELNFASQLACIQRGSAF